MAIADDLHLDVPGTLDVALDDDGVVAEAVAPLGGGLGEGGGEPDGLVHDADALATTARRGLDEHGKADLGRRGGEIVGVL